MPPKRELKTGRVRRPSHKGVKHTRGFLAPVRGRFRTNLKFEAPLHLEIDDIVEYYMDHGEPIIVRKKRRR